VYAMSIVVSIEGSFAAPEILDQPAGALLSGAREARQAARAGWAPRSASYASPRGPISISRALHPRHEPRHSRLASYHEALTRRLVLECVGANLAGGPRSFWPPPA
jgi:hypothetical protein